MSRDFLYVKIRAIMSMPNSSVEPPSRIFPAALLVLSVVCLFVLPKLWVAESKPTPELTSNWIKLMRDTNVTGPEGNTVSFDEAIKNGWVDVSTTRFANAIENSNLPSATMTYRVSNKTTKPIRIRIPTDKQNPAIPKTLDIPPGDTKPVETATVGTPSGMQSIMPIVVTLVLLVGSLFVILAKRYQATDRHWAYGTVGTIVGYWLKG